MGESRAPQKEAAAAEAPVALVRTLAGTTAARRRIDADGPGDDDDDDNDDVDDDDGGGGGGAWVRGERQLQV